MNGNETVLLEKRRELRQAVGDLQRRKLNEAARWASTQLLGTRKPSAAEEPAVDPRGTLSTDAEDAYAFASSSFDAREYNTAVWALEPHKAGGSSDTVFLYYYSRYLKIQKFKVNKQKGATQANALLVEAELSELRAELQGLSQPDGFQLYVLGMALMDQNRLREARQVLVQSAQLYPCNWSAWKALAASCRDIASFREVEPTLPDHFMADFFKAHVLVEMHHVDEGLAVVASRLESDFPESPAIKYTQAVAYSYLRNYDLSHDTFQHLLAINPHTIEGMDVYSNILYVKEDHVELTLLARRLVDEDPYRSETCCVIGNFYSFRGAHDRAILYFQRALKLNPNCLAAWTLMGHEFIELKNPPAAIEAYRKAVAYNPSDFRAWYGLGQTYELVNMPYYALHYFSKAAAIRPNDSRMWNAMGKCYSSPAVGKIESAIRCYKRALPHDRELVSLRQLAHHHDVLAQSGKDAQHYEEAAKYYTMILEQSEADQEGGQREDTATALHFLAAYHKKSGDLHLSQDYYSRLLDFGLPQHREVAKLSLKEIQEMQEMQSPMMQSPAGDVTPGSTRPW
jgi:anaphase-promoting complex subunit 8